MEIANSPLSTIIWNGKNVTGDLKPFLSSVSYTDNEEGAADDVSLVLDNGSGLWSSDWHPAEGDTLELYLGYEKNMMNCGLFQVDEITFSGKPDIITVKAIASFVNKTLRTRNSKAFEKQTLRQISSYFCTKHGLKLIDNSDNMLNQIFIDRKTQEEKTDLQFLSELATEYGFIFSVKGDNLIFTSFYNLDNAEAVKDISIFQIGMYNITEKCFDTYKYANLTKRSSKTNSVETENQTFDGVTVKDDVLLIVGTGGNKKTVEAKVKSGLWNKNRFKQSGTLNDLPGDPLLVAAMNFNLTGLGLISGKYHIVKSNHTITGDGAYTTSLDVRKTGDIPKPKQVPPTKAEKTTFDENTNDYEANNSEEIPE